MGPLSMGPAFDSLEGDRKTNRAQEHTHMLLAARQNGEPTFHPRLVCSFLPLPLSPAHSFRPLQSIHSHISLLTCNAGPFKTF